jgi:hypothetical protein
MLTGTVADGRDVNSVISMEEARAVDAFILLNRG